MEQILHSIHRVNDYERFMFHAKHQSCTETLDRWYSNLRPDQANNNFFLPTGTLTCLDIDTAIDIQKKRGLNYVMFRTTSPIDVNLRELFAFEEDVTCVMALLKNNSENWKEHPKIEIRDIQTSDISSDLLDVSSVPEQYRQAAYRNMQLVLKAARENPNYHWLCAYLNGVRVGSVYALSHQGFVEMDDLWVETEYRNQYIATTLMKYIVKTYGGILYLHADASATPKEMYARMGFETVETIYDYYLEWD